MKVLISACLLGFQVRYDGQGKRLFEQQAGIEYHPLCPEVLGGLSVPREPCEIRSERVVSPSGADKTKEFQFGAQKVLAYVQDQGIDVVVLKENSPSCGSQRIYDGSFQSKKIAGMGMTTRLLKEHGIEVINEDQWKKYLIGAYNKNESI